MLLLKNKVALVTGTSGGIGQAILLALAKEGCDVYAHARVKSVEHALLCEEIGKNFNVKIIPIYFDLRDYDVMINEIKSIYKRCNHIDVLVNNASIVHKPQLFSLTSIDSIKLEFDVNFFSQLYITQYISRLMMKKKSGSIINISSVAGIDGNTGMIGYVSSKAAMIGATKRLAIEFGEYNIRVNSIAPGLTNTNMGNMMSDELKEKTLNHQVFSHMAEPIDIANAVVFLGSDLSKHITGQVIRVDGGMLR